MVPNVKEGRLKGFAKLGYFPTIVDTSALYEADAPRVVLEGAYSCAKTDNITTTNIPADDNPAWDTENDWEDTTLTIVVRGLLLSDLAALKGATLDTDGTLYESISDVTPSVALNFAALQNNGGYRCFAYFVCELQSAQVSNQTVSGGGNTTLQDYTLEFRCKGRTAGKKRIRATQEVATAADADAWLATVPGYPNDSED